LAHGKVRKQKSILGKAPFLLLLLTIILWTEGCSQLPNIDLMRSQCFQNRPSVVRPDPLKIYPNLSTGAAGITLVEAIYAGEVDKALALLLADKRLLATQVRFDPRMDSAPEGQYGDLLTFAVAACNPEMIAVLLENGVAPDGVQRGQALTLALLADTPEMAEMLLVAGASADPQKAGGAQAMREQLAFGNVGGVMTLIRHGADVHAVDGFGDDLLSAALSMEQYVSAELLVERGANLWLITGAGSINAWALQKPPVLSLSKGEAATRDRLMVLANQWPTPDMQKAGMRISPEAKSDIHARFGKSGS
jgi:hypothetical protein